MFVQMEAFIDPGKVGRVFHCGDGFSYHQTRLRRVNDNCNVHYLRCSKYATPQACNGSALIRLNRGVARWENNQPHTCLADPLAHDERVLRHDILEECRNGPHRYPAEIVETHAARYLILYQ